MPSAAITSKGQITLPKTIRDRLGVRTGDRVRFRERPDGAIVVEAETVELMDLCGSIRPAKRGVTVEQMDEAIRRHATKR